MCVHTQLLNPTQHITYYPLLSDLETSKLQFLGSRSWQKCTCNIPDGEKLHADSMHIPYTHGLLSELFCPATAAVCLGKTSGTRS